MLLAVEGGGFFSSSASGYSKGLTLLLLGQKKEEKPMRVSPWNQYQLVDQESHPDLQLASTKNRLVRRCASFFCFGRAAAGLESPSPLKVGPTQQQDILPAPPVTDKGKDHIHTTDLVEDDSNTGKLALKSNLKKPTNTLPVSGGVVSECEVLCENGSDIPGHMERRKVQWTDASGGEIAQIREFELSDVGGSDDEFDNGDERNCSCRIM
ncbi:unnamed protein product [Camellia sinensis]|uniref:uncharacterized protein LOC114309708 n=1 Tax=Camellia sinensis TaxID=4442 RepID=UPI0010369255|nr:uncharacterized protein LOC114309708 [Camellia sinensis]XP_028111300.1 uncharacterized protein LOC114309708 [Camellia sinensis]XP_028111307.1 uncharacterized protein LOC114309708 [Camellia sinensis]XP_028111314.1 uncharacterized protein LOC114309708 [Camellia sinensis]XP_028111323.1 uncharacterized protein LOC114309708 [Camellia sinensis]XP_028111332.1 uncharacterized protein LOC114309708 [Camellia sinensis]